MRFLVIILSVLVLTACGTSKEVNKQNAETNQESETTTTSSTNHRVIGIVRENCKGCGYCLETETEPGVIKFLHPLNLDLSFLKEGTKIKFDFAINRKMKPADCKADFIVKVYDVTRIR
jgi:hypothetical protein